MTKKPPQNSLFESDSFLYGQIRRLQKVDLHRHLTGSIDAELALRIATTYDVELPLFDRRGLDDLLTSLPEPRSLASYFEPWKILNSLFVSIEATREIMLNLIRQAAEDNVRYVEFRLGPKGFIDKSDPFTFDEFLQAIADAVVEGQRRYGTIARCLLGIPRHVTKFQVDRATRKKMFYRMISALSRFSPHIFVGVDINGDESKQDAGIFDDFCQYALEKHLHVTVHAGELGSTANVSQALADLHAQRIGHGLAAAGSSELLSALSRARCPLEICPTSYLVLQVLNTVSELPLTMLRNYHVPFVICTDNPARCKTTMTEELFKVAKAFSLSFEEVQRINLSALSFSFADDSVREAIGQSIKLQVTAQNTLEVAL